MSNEQKESAFQYSWEWFKYHAQQRYLAFNIFLLVMGALAYGYALAEKSSHLKFAVGTLGFVLSFSFMFIEKRSNTLVNDGRTELNKLERGGVFEAPILGKDENNKDDCWILKHKFWFRFVIIVSMIVSYLAMLDSLKLINYSELRKMVPDLFFYLAPIVLILVAGWFGFFKCEERDGRSARR